MPQVWYDMLLYTTYTNSKILNLDMGKGMCEIDVIIDIMILL